MVALWIKAGTLLLGQTALGVRLLGPFAAALASWMLFDAARALFPGTQAGIVAVLLLNASLLLGVGTVIMTPDSPLLFFWTATLWAVARVAAGGSGMWWLVAGVAGGLALDSKYTAFFQWLGVGLWVLLVPAAQGWLRRWQPWAASIAGLALFAPVVCWNATHGWASFARQGGRVDDWHPARAIGFLGELVGGQIGLATPLVWVLCMIGLVVAARLVWRDRDPRWSLLIALSLPPIVVFVQHAFGDRVQGNWPAIIYPAACIAAAGLAAPLWLRLRSPGVAIGLVITLLVYLHAATELVPLPPRLDPVAQQLAGWNGLARQVDAARQQSRATFVVADQYALAAELARTLPPQTEIVGLEPRWSLTTLPQAKPPERVGLLVRSFRRGDVIDSTTWENVIPAGVAVRSTGTTPVETYRLFRVIGTRLLTDAVVLPRP
jgi:4-amino-4-deoxy-L-arabinose transferase-like glycosyltransferase